MTSRPFAVLALVKRWSNWGENLLLVLLLCAMVGLAGVEIVLRNFFGGGLIWADELLRLLVLWVAMFGALAATRDRNQIAIDLLARWLPPQGRRWADLVTCFFSALICGLLAWHAGRFVWSEWSFGARALGDLPAWPFQSILPAGFGLLAWRYLYQTVEQVLRIVQGEQR